MVKLPFALPFFRIDGCCNWGDVEAIEDVIEESAVSEVLPEAGASAALTGGVDMGCNWNSCEVNNYDLGSEFLARGTVSRVDVAHILVRQLLQTHTCLECAEEFARSWLSSAVAIGSSLASESTIRVADSCYGNVLDYITSRI